MILSFPTIIYITGVVDVIVATAGIILQYKYYIKKICSHERLTSKGLQVG